VTNRAPHSLEDQQSMGHAPVASPVADPTGAVTSVVLDLVRTMRILVEDVRGQAPTFSPGGTTLDKPKILTAKELRGIMPRLAGWKLAQQKLSRTFEFQDFVQSLSFVNSLVAYFETVDHHPDVRIAYGEVTFELTRYDVGGKVTDRDVEVAKKISSEYRARS